MSKCVFPGGIPLVAVNGAQIKVESSQCIGWAILKEGAYEPKTLTRAAIILENGGGFVDVGANIGLFTVYLGVIPDVQCLSVEPHPENFTKLKNNVGLNKSIRTHFSHLALGGKTELLNLEEINLSNSGTVRVHSADEYATNNIFTVAAFPLETVLEHSGFGRITLLKIDVEGYEFSVLEGLNWSGVFRPDNVLIEFSDYTKRFEGRDRRALINFFATRGYSGYTVEGNPLLPGDSPPEDNAWFRDNSVRPLVTVFS